MIPLGITILKPKTVSTSQRIPQHQKNFLLSSPWRLPRSLYLSQSLSFHSSPVSFFSFRAGNVSPQHFSLEENVTSALPQIVRSRILSRNVAIISSHQFCKDVLETSNSLPQTSFKAAILDRKLGPKTFTVDAAYHQPMSDLFPYSYIFPPQIQNTQLPNIYERPLTGYVYLNWPCHSSGNQCPYYTTAFKDNNMKIS